MTAGMERVNDSVAIPMPEEAQAKSPKTTCWGLSWQNWTRAFGSIGVMDAGVGIYRFIEGDTVSATIHVVSAVAIGILVGAVEYYKPIKTFENRVKDLTVQVGRLNQEKNDLLQGAKDLETGIDTLKNVQQDADEKLAKLKKRYDAKTADLKKVASDLKLVISEKDNLEKLYSEAKELVEKFAGQVKKLDESRQKVEGDSDTLDKKIKELDKNEDEVSEEMEEFRYNNNTMALEVQNLKDLAASFSMEVSSIKERIEGYKQNIEELQKQVSIVDDADDKIKDGANTLKEVVDEQKVVMDKIAEGLKELKED